MRPTGPYLRQDVWSLPADAPVLRYYGDAVTAMKARPASDPRSWSYQAAIHGSAAASPPALADECRHQSWWFLPWHRMYLYYFERIVRAEVVAAGGPADWALPYWDYDREGTRTLPPAFRSPTRPDGSPNPLYADRRPGLNSGSLALSPSVTSAAFALTRPQYTGTDQFGGGTASGAGMFSGRTGAVESTPHNGVHVQIGGLMSNPATAGQDPVFWLHHCNVDRLWWVWNRDGGANPGEAAYRDQRFEFFDADGTRTGLRCRDVDDPPSQLRYAYERGPLFPDLRLPPELLERLRRRPPWPPWLREVRVPPLPPRPGARDGAPADEPPPTAAAEVVGGTGEPVRLVGGEARVHVDIDARAQSDALGGATPRSVVLSLEDVDAEREPGTVYGVHVALPDDPSPEDLHAHHVGNLALFGVERARQQRGDEHAHGGMQVSLDITGLVERLTRRGAWDPAAVDVTFRPVPLEVVRGAPESDAVADEAGAPAHEDAPVTIGRISVAVR